MKRSERVRDAQTSKKIAKRERESEREMKEAAATGKGRPATSFKYTNWFISFTLSDLFFCNHTKSSTGHRPHFFPPRFGSFRCLLAASFARWGPAEISAVRTLDPLLCSNSSSSSYIWLLFLTASPIYVVFFCFMRIFLPCMMRRSEHTKSWNFWNFSEDIIRFGNQDLCKRKENNSNDRWHSSVNYWNFTALDPSKINFSPLEFFFAVRTSFQFVLLRKKKTMTNRLADQADQLRTFQCKFFMQSKVMLSKVIKKKFWGNPGCKWD